jgi:cyclohexanone monooxygenase
VERLTEKGIVANGVEYEVDCVVFASGFEISTEISRRYAVDVIEGRDGLSLFDHWHDRYQTLHGMTTRGFPNQFFTGFIQGGVSANTTAMFEQQAEHIAYIIAEAQTRRDHRRAQRAGAGRLGEHRPGTRDRQLGVRPVLHAGYYNNEGQGGAKDNGAFLGDYYSPGFYAFGDLIAEWRAKGDLDGLVLETE